jgi:uncharacterized glyoxalase superfamily protein PhnB
MKNSTVIPGAMYQNAPAAIDWLCAAFGFERHAVYPGKGNTIMHAELVLDGGMLMLGTARPGAHEPGISLIMEDADAVYQRAMAAGAEIVEEIGDKPYGGRGFVCRDLEGKICDVVTYNPWAAN